MASVKRGDIRVRDIRFAFELAFEPIFNRRALTVKHPQREAQRPHVLRAQRVFLAETEILDRLDSQLANVESQHIIFGEAIILERRHFIFRLVEIALGELACVDNDQSARLERVQIHLERSRVHRHQHIGRIASRIDRAATEIDLECRHAEQCALRCANLSRKIRESRQIIASKRGRERKLTAR